jgi:lipoate-protein ligase A
MLRPVTFYGDLIKYSFFSEKIWLLFSQSIELLIKIFKIREISDKAHFSCPEKITNLHKTKNMRMLVPFDFP